MKRIWWAAAALCLVGAPAMAQSTTYGGDFTVFGAYANTRQANSSSRDVFNNQNNDSNNYGGGVKLRWSFIEFRASYFDGIETNRLRFQCNEPLCNGNDFKVRMIPLELGLVYKFPAGYGRFNPYIGAGGGYYLLRGTNNNAASTSGNGSFKIDSEVGYYGVLGTDININPKVGINVEGLYRDVRGTVRVDQNDLVEGVSNKVNVQLGGWGVNAGVVFHF